MKHILSNVAGKILYLRKWFIYILILYFLSQLSIYTYSALEWLQTPILLFTGIFILCSAIQFKEYIKTKYMGLIIVFLSIIGITVILNIKTGLYMNIRYYFWVIIFLTIVYPAISTISITQCKKYMYTTSYIIIVITFLFSLFSIYSLAFPLPKVMNISYGEPILSLGFWKNRLFGIYVEPNQGAMISIVSLALSFIILIMQKSNSSINKNFKRVLTVFLVFNIFIQWSYTLLSDSRGALISFIAFIFLIVLLFPFDNKIVKDISFKSIAIRVICGIIAVLLIFEAGILIKKCYSYLPKMIEQEFKVSPSTDKNMSQDLQNESKDNTITFARQEGNNGAIVLKDESTQARVKIIHDSIKLIMRSPILGLSHYGVSYYTDKMGIENEYLKNGSTHNVYIYSLISTGIVGLLIWMLLTIIILFKSIKLCFTQSEDRQNKAIVTFILAILVAMHIFALVFQILFTVPCVFTLIEWILLANLTVFTTNEKGQVLT